MRIPDINAIRMWRSTFWLYSGHKFHNYMV